MYYSTKFAGKESMEHTKQDCQTAPHTDRWKKVSYFVFLINDFLLRIHVPDRYRSSIHVISLIITCFIICKWKQLKFLVLFNISLQEVYLLAYIFLCSENLYVFWFLFVRGICWLVRERNIERCNKPRINIWENN